MIIGTGFLYLTDVGADIILRPRYNICNLAGRKPGSLRMAPHPL